jgi:release factor glutamine methyltransferase
VSAPGPSPQDKPDTAQRLLTRRFTEAHLDSPALDARLLVQHVTGLTATQMLLATAPLSPAQADVLEALALRRIKREPMARLLGEREFYGLSFALNEACLIPRPDSEVLIDRALALTGPSGLVLDLGTGPGTLLLAFLANKPGWTGLGVDLAPQALEAAASNAERLGLAARGTFQQGSWCEGLTGRFALILSNPPYIPSSDCESLQDEVRLHDPHLALDGGADGLTAYRAIMTQAPAFLVPNGLLILEAGIGQAEDIRALAEQAGLTWVESAHDLGGIPRAVVLRQTNGKPLK